MTNGEDQAEADFEVETTGDESQDESHDPTAGATDLKSYEEEVARLSEPQEESVDIDEEPTAEEEDAEEQDQEEEETPEEEESEGDVDETSTEDDAEEEESEEEEPEEEEPEAKKPSRFRIQAKDQVETEALALRKRHSDWSLEKCLSKAKELLGVSDKTEESESPEDAAPVRTVADAKTQLKELRQKRSDAMKAIELDEAADLSDQIDTLTDEIAELQVTEATRNQEKEAAIQSARHESEAKAVKFYPDSANPESPLVAEMHRLMEVYQETEDPILNDPDKLPFKLTQIAAANLNIGPTTDSGGPRKKTKKKTVRRSTLQPASGSNRSTTTAAPTKKVDDAIDGVGSLDDYEELVGTM